MNPLALIFFAIIVATAAALLGLIVGLRILAAAIVEAISYWKLPEKDELDELHSWDWETGDGTRCTKCGDKDWFSETTCPGKKP